jgi:hypothetical protein
MYWPAATATVLPSIIPEIYSNKPAVNLLLTIWLLRRRAGAAKTGPNHHIRAMVSPTRYTGRQSRASDDAIVDLYVTLKDSNAAALRAGCSAPTVLKIVRAAGIEVGPQGGPTGRRVRLAIPESEICEKYRAGMIAREIAAQAGCSITVIYRILDTAGIDRRRVRPQPSKPLGSSGA